MLDGWPETGSLSQAGGASVRARTQAPVGRRAYRHVYTEQDQLAAECTLSPLCIPATPRLRVALAVNVRDGQGVQPSKPKEDRRR